MVTATEIRSGFGGYGDCHRNSERIRGLRWLPPKLGVNSGVAVAATEIQGVVVIATELSPLDWSSGDGYHQEITFARSVVVCGGFCPCF